ncbi:hypothetical protein GGF43_006175, partial [Coemansia sp. RSA 2618]
ERVRVLQEAGQHALAYLTAKTHGLVEDAEAIRAAAEVDEASIVLPPGVAF